MVIVKEPAFPIPVVLLDKPVVELLSEEMPYISTDSEALTFKLPPSPAPRVPVVTCAPSERNKMGVFIVKEPALPIPAVPVDKPLTRPSELTPKISTNSEALI